MAPKAKLTSEEAEILAGLLHGHQDLHGNALKCIMVASAVADGIAKRHGRDMKQVLSDYQREWGWGDAKER